MTLLLANNAEGGTNGTTVTTGNSGGTSGNAWDTVSIGGTTTLTYSTANPAHGSGLGYQFTQPATLAACNLQWSTSMGTLSTGQTLAGRLYYFPPVAIPASSIRLITITAAGAVCSVFHASGTGKLEIHDSAGSLTGSASSVGLSASTMYRIEFLFTGIGTSTTSGAGTVRLFLGDGTTAQGTDATSSSSNFGTVAPTTIKFGFGTANGTASQSYYLDGIQVNDSGLPGPETTPTPRKAIFHTSMGLLNRPSAPPATRLPRMAWR